MNPAEAPLPLLVLQTFGSGLCTAYAVSIGWAWVAVPMAAFCGWSMWLVGRRLVGHR